MKYYCFLLFLVLSLFTFSQTLDLEWAFNFGNISHDYSRTAIDNDGNVIVAGDYEYTVDFDPGPGTTNLYGKRSLFLAKFDANGSLIWVKDYDTTYTTDGIKSIAFDQNNNIYLHGTCVFNVDFDPGSNTAYLPADTSFLLRNFVTKLDSDGNFQWVRSINSGTQILYGIDVDPAGNVYGTGKFNSASFDFDPGPNVLNLPKNASSYAGFIFKWSPSGDMVWTKLIDATFKVEPIKIQVTKDNNVIISGSYSNQVDFDPGAGVNNTYNTSGSCSFVAKYNLNGDLSWVNSYSGSNFITGSANEINQTGVIALYGSFTGSVDTDPGAGVNNLTPNSGNSGFYVITMNSDGSSSWSRIIADEFKTYRVISDSNGDYYLVGSFTDQCAITNQYFYLNSPGQNLLIVKTNINGKVMNVYHVANNPTNMINITSISSYQDAIYYNGGIRESANFSFNSSTSSTLTSNGNIDTYVAKYQLGALGLKEENNNTGFTIYPNPAKELLYLDTKSLGLIEKVTINDLNGRIIKEINDLKEGNAISISELISGTYLVVITDQNQKTYSELFMKE